MSGKIYLLRRSFPTKFRPFHNFASDTTDPLAKLLKTYVRQVSSLCGFQPAPLLCSFGMRGLQDFFQVPTLEPIIAEAGHLRNRHEALFPFLLVFLFCFQIAKYQHSLHQLLLYLSRSISCSILIHSLTLDLVHFLYSNVFLDE